MNTTRVARKEERTEAIQIAVLVFFVLMVLSLALSLFMPAIADMSRRVTIGAQLTSLNEGWQRLEPDGSHSPLTLPCQVEAAPGEDVVIQRRLPQKLPVSASLTFSSTQQSVRVYREDELIYTWDNSASRPFGKATPSSWNFVRLNAQGGENITIVLNSPYQVTSGLLESILLGPYSDGQLSAILAQLPDFVVCYAMLLFGFALTIIALTRSLSPKQDKQILYLGLFTMVIALYLRTEIDLPQLYWLNDFLSLQLTFMLMMLSPLPYILYAKTRLSRGPRRILNWLFCLFAANFWICLLLQLYNIADFYQTIVVTHILIAALAVCMVVFFLRGLARKIFHPTFSETVGLSTLCLAFLGELLAFYLPGQMATGTFMRWGMCIYIIGIVVAAIQEVSSQRSERAKITQELQENKMQLLIDQVKPHFIYNTLAAIRSLIAENPDEASRMVYVFSKYLRVNIDSLTHTELIPFSQELEHIRTYAELEVLRFQGRVAVCFDIQAEDFLVPPLSIQPLVENAVKHGVCFRREGGNVLVSTMETDNYIVIRVEDDGVGFVVEDGLAVDKPGSTGLKNITFRLKEAIGARMDIVSQLDCGTLVTIIIDK